MAVAKRVGQVQAWIILTACYWVLLAPIALVFRWTSDPLQLRKGAAPRWHPKTPPPDRMTWAKSQSDAVATSQKLIAQMMEEFAQIVETLTARLLWSDCHCGFQSKRILPNTASASAARSVVAT